MRLNTQENGLEAWWHFPQVKENLEPPSTWHIRSRYVFTRRDVMAWTYLQSNRSFASHPLTEENLLKCQRGHRGHPGGESVPCAVCPGHGVWLPSVFLPRQVVVCGLGSQRHDLVSCQLRQLVCGAGNKTWVLPHPCPSSAPQLLMGTNYEGGSCSAAV